MNYKDRYNKLVEAIKVLQEINPNDEGIQNWVNDNVPELKESEHEMIRKELIEQVAYIIPKNDEVDDEGEALPTYQKRIDKYRAWLEKQREQKSATWSEEDDFKLSNHRVQDILEELGMLDDNGYCPHTAEEIFRSALEYYALHYVKTNKQDWSIEDEDIINRLIKICDEKQEDFPPLSLYFEELECLKDWLESLRLQTQWKPTEGQMETLEATKYVKILNAGKVIEWLKETLHASVDVIANFKKDFGV